MAGDFTFERKPSAHFSIVYAGHIAASQNPENLLEAMSKLEDINKGVLKLHFYGSQDVKVHQIINDLALEDMVVQHGYVAHNVALQAMVNADALLLVLPKENSKGIMTGKVYEYLATNNYILTLGDPEGEIAELITECGAGHTYSYTQDLLPVLSELINNWRKKEAIHQPNETKIEQYSRKAITGQLAKIFDKLSLE